MSIITIQNTYKFQINELYNKFSALKECFIKQYNEIKEIYKMIHGLESGKSEQAGRLISPIVERLENPAPIHTIEINNNYIKELSKTIHKRPNLYKEDLDACYDLIEQITRKNIEQFSTISQEYGKYYSYIFSYQKQHTENLELLIEVADGKLSYTLYSGSMRQQVSEMRALFQMFKKNIEEFKNHFPTRPLLAE